MKLSKEKTSWLIIKAITGFEWDYATFAVIELTKDYIKTLNQWLKIAQSLKDNTDFLCLTYWDNPNGWYKIPDEFEEIITAFCEGELRWSFLSLEGEEELSRLTLIKEIVEAQQIDIYPDGEARFRGRGLVTEMEYRTVDFSINKL